MKLLVIGDLHGLNTWKSLVEEYEYDKVIFLGDYVDSFDVPDDCMIKNLQELIEFKKENMDKVILLWGNHDLQYIDKGFRCSGYRGKIADILYNIFNPNKELFKVNHSEGNYVFSHAGFTNGWLDNYFPVSWSTVVIPEYFRGLEDVSIERGGMSEYGSPVWAGKEETTRDGKVWDGFIQVVGHTAVAKIEDKGHIIYCDNIEYGNAKPLVLNIE